MLRCLKKRRENERIFRIGNFKKVNANFVLFIKSKKIIIAALIFFLSFHPNKYSKIPYAWPERNNFTCRLQPILKTNIIPTLPPHPSVVLF